MLGARLLSLLVLVSVTCGSPVVDSSGQGDRHTVRKRVSNLPLIGGGDDDVASLEMLKNKNKFDPKKQNVEVKLIEAWGPDHPYRKQMEHQDHQKRLSSPGVQSFSSSHSSVRQYHNLNGNVVTNTDQKDKAVENGQLVASLHRANLQQATKGQKPKIEELTELDIPDENIHKKVLSKNGKAVNFESASPQLHQLTAGPAKKRSLGELDPALLGHFDQLAAEEDQRRKRIQEDKLATAEELSKYILETGDEQGVANYFQDLMLDGQLGEYEVLDYLNLIKSLLTVEKESEIEMEREEEREREAQMILDFSDYLDSKYQNGEIPSNLYRGLKGKLMESVIERAAADPQFLGEPLSRRR